uniref:Uncharacterized protein n=1 Tax=Setaria italica TaxID=4555 RepID=K3ZPK3_SETIT
MRAILLETAKILCVSRTEQQQLTAEVIKDSAWPFGSCGETF